MQDEKRVAIMKDARDEANSTGAATEDIALKKLMAEDSEIA